MLDIAGYRLRAELTQPNGNTHGWEHPLTDIANWNFNAIGDIKAYIAHKTAELECIFDGCDLELEIRDEHERVVASYKGGEDE